VPLDLMLVGPQPAGTWVLAFRGAAMRVMTADEARQTDAALDALERVLAGDGNVDSHFADLVDREPMLPDHLKGPGR
jgi:hydrogenase expression/formation protein HypC